MTDTLKKAIKKANITYDDIEIHEITSTMSQEDIDHTGKLGIKYWKVLRKLVLKKMDEELKLNNNDVIGKYFIWGVAAFGPINMWTSGGAFYYRIVISKDTFYSYGYDQNFSCISRISCPIMNLRSIKQGRVGDYRVLPRDGIIINTEDRNHIILLGSDKYAKSDLGCIIRDLSNINDSQTQVNIFASDIIE